jgi:predicted MFS family arabinose efflux permease
VLGGAINVHLGWRWAFYLVTPPGLLLGMLCFWQRDPRARAGEQALKKRARRQDYLTLIKTRSFVLNCLAQTAMTFALGGIAFWMPAYLQFRQQPDSSRILLGAITVVAGLISTIAGGVLGDRLRSRFPGSYFLVSGVGMLIAFPLFLGMLYAPFPAAWFLFFGAVFFVFLNTGPSNTALANVALPTVRATAFALNILVIHLFGDAFSPPLIGAIAGHWNMNIGFFVVSGTMLLSGVLWQVGMRVLDADTEAVELVSAVSRMV